MDTSSVSGVSRVEATPDPSLKHKSKKTNLQEAIKASINAFGITETGQIGQRKSRKVFTKPFVKHVKAKLPGVSSAEIVKRSQWKLSSQKSYAKRRAAKPYATCKRCLLAAERKNAVVFHLTKPAGIEATEMFTSYPIVVQIAEANQPRPAYLAAREAAAIDEAARREPAAIVEEAVREAAAIDEAARRKPATIDEAAFREDATTDEATVRPPKPKKFKRASAEVLRAQQQATLTDNVKLFLQGYVAAMRTATEKHNSAAEADGLLAEGQKRVSKAEELLLEEQKRASKAESLLADEQQRSTELEARIAELEASLRCYDNDS